MHLVTLQAALKTQWGLLREGQAIVAYSSEVVMLQEQGIPLKARELTINHEVPSGDLGDALIFGSGGLGDRIQATLAMESMARRTRTGQVDVACLANMDEWDGLGFIGNRYRGSAPAWLLENYDTVVTWEGIVGGDFPEAKTLPMHQLFAAYMGVQMPRIDERPLYNKQPGEERMSPLYRAPRQRQRIAVHLGTHSPARAWPAQSWHELIEALRGKYDVVLVGQAQEAPTWETIMFGQRYLVPPPAGIIDLCAQTPYVRSLAATIADCDLFVGVDSGPLHLAGTLGVPCVGLYSTHPYSIRGTNMPITPVEVDLAAAECPCHCQITPTMPLPCGKPACDMMVAISSEMVIATVEDAIGCVPLRSIAKDGLVLV